MKNTINIAYTFDDNYAQHGGISLLSLLENNIDLPEIVVYIIDNNISIRNKQNIKDICNKYNRSISFIGVDLIKDRIKINTSFSISAYGCIFLDFIENIDKILVIDADTIINGSIRDLYNTSIDNCLVAGVQDTINPYYIGKTGLSYNDRYINSGVLLLNLKLWRDKEITKKAIEYILENNGNPPFDDQGTVNNVCNGYIKILEPKYNLMNPMNMFSTLRIKGLYKIDNYYSQNEIDEAVNNPIIIHFTAEYYNRPWFDDCSHPKRYLYDSFLSKSPWKGSLHKPSKISTNCKIQKIIYDNFPFFIYKLMVRFIEYRHRVKEIIYN